MRIPTINIFIGGEGLGRKKEDNPLRKALLKKKETDEDMLAEMRKVKDEIKNLPHSGSFHAGGG